MLLILIVLTGGVYFVAKKDLMNVFLTHIRSDLLTANDKLRSRNEKLIQEMAALEKQNQDLKQALVDQTIQFSMLNEASKRAWIPGTIPEGESGGPLDEASFLNRQIYQALLAEKKRWDASQQLQYRDILESTLEPAIVDSRYLNFENDENRERFLEIEKALNLHKRLIRDIRLFHDEVQFRQKQLPSDPSYALYDLKFNLEPFARESAIADALQQAMSAIGAGIYSREAAQVLDRLGEAFVKPIQELSQWLEDPTDASGPSPYNYNFYIVFGKKLMNYADTLAGQSMLPLAPPALGELDFFSRRIAQSLVQLQEAGGEGSIDPALLDVEALEQDRP
jgi:hypothetical protein